MEWRKQNLEDPEGVSAPYGIIWVDVEINPSPGCSWADFSFESNCDYLDQMLQAIKKHG